ncbi:MAG: hypothetical protein GY854_25635 [Deltaproteobacteria bacterium]|nr:hypothetical protein [Deltaproteobacteria bacterium]
MGGWTLVLKDKKTPFDTGEALLRHVEHQLGKLLQESPLSKVSIQDPEGVYYDLSIDISLKRVEFQKA